jgi:hypothetical protein
MTRDVDSSGRKSKKHMMHVISVITNISVQYSDQCVLSAQSHRAQSTWRNPNAKEPNPQPPCSCTLDAGDFDSAL